MKISNEQLQLTANTIRCLSIDAIQKAKSGHPGLPLGLADVATVLWLKYLNHDPKKPSWENRDRFVMSGGHGSALLYSLLHLSGYNLSLDDMRAFRQLGSKTPGHPEYGITDGVETTTGPLGQGIAIGIGMALAERMLAARVNSDKTAFKPVDHKTVIMCGDGDLMEGISHEACSLAGHLGLEKLVLFFDSNAITIEGSTNLACSDNVKMRFQSYNWRVLEVDGHDFDAIDAVMRKAFKPCGKPTIVICKTIIGKGSPNKSGKCDCHGAPLGEDEVRLTKKALGFDENASFVVPNEVYSLFAEVTKVLHRNAKRWEKSFAAWRLECPEEASMWHRLMSGELPENIESCLPEFPLDKPVATRSASGKIINAIAPIMPSLVGGSADLGPSNNTIIKDADDVMPGSFAGRNIHFGIRELAMSAIMSGVTLHGGFRIFGGTFFVFSDYCRPAIRLAALMRLPLIFVFTHDSFYVGEDGPTHQPIEQLAAIRSIPNVLTLRPSDATETVAAWLAALRNTTGPTALILTRQNVAVIDRTTCAASGNLAKGGYTLFQSGTGTPDLTIIASGSEVELALGAARELEGRNIRVVSMPSRELFASQPQEYRDSVLDPMCQKRILVEAGSSFGWDRFIGPEGLMLTIDHFGSSGPYAKLATHFGFTIENVKQMCQTI